MISLTLKELRLIFRNGTEVIPFAERVSFFHGEMGSGKSSIPALVDFCLGASAGLTPALNQELVDAGLALRIEGNEVLLEREAGSSQVRASWIDATGAAHHCIAPLRARSDTPPLVETEPEVKALTDLLFYLGGHGVVRVRKRTYDPDSPFVRLSFRDLLEFVYLSQEELDSDFFLLRQPVRAEKSKDAIQWLVGYRSERLLDLQQMLQEVRQKQRTDRQAAVQLRGFLAQFGYGSVGAIDDELQALTDEARQCRQDLGGVVPGEGVIAEEDLVAFRRTSSELLDVREAFETLRARIDEQDKLRNELVSLKLRTARLGMSRELLGGVTFEACPACGAEVDAQHSHGYCYLCKTPAEEQRVAKDERLELIQRDLDARIIDLEQALARQRRALKPVGDRVEELRERRAELEGRLAEARRAVETEEETRRRRLEGRLAAISERSSLLRQLRRMPEEIERVEAEADAMAGEIEHLAREIETEETRLEHAERNFMVIEENWKRILLDIGFPGLSKNDQIIINRKNLIPEVWPGGSQHRAWDFFNIGSGGKKTLMKITYALALHLSAAERNLPMPSLLMIDSPTKNITPDINKEVFDRFYRVLYDLLREPLVNWQVLLVDQTLAPPPPELGET